MHKTITIPTPCLQNWDTMQPNNQGRHCNVCQKTVIDFTNWQAPAVMLHLENNTNVCGRFTTYQLNEQLPSVENFVKQLSYFSIPFLKKVAAIFLFVFGILGTSLKTYAQGETKQKKDSAKTEHSVAFGGVAIIPPSQLKLNVPKQLFFQKKQKANKLKSKKVKIDAKQNKIIVKNNALYTSGLVGYGVNK